MTDKSSMEDIMVDAIMNILLNVVVGLVFTLAILIILKGLMRAIKIEKILKIVSYRMVNTIFLR